MRRSLIELARKAPFQLHYASRSTVATDQTVGNKLGTGVSKYCFYSSQSSTAWDRKDLHLTVKKIIHLPIGSIDEVIWEDAEQVLRECCRHGESVEMAIHLLDRLVKEDGISPSFNPLNLIVLNWRNQFKQKQQNSSLLPSHVVGKIDEWRSTASSLQPDTKTYAMILESAATYTQDHSEGVLFADALLEWLLEESKMQFSIRPTVFCFAAVMNAWVWSGRAEASAKVEEWIHRLEALHQEGWPDLEPTVSLYNILLNAQARAGDVEKAEQLLHAMLHNEIPVHPDHISFSTLLSAYSKLHHPHAVARAETLLERMHELYQAGYESAKPNVIAYTTLMNCHAREGNGEQAEILLQRLENLFMETQDPDWKPDVRAYNMVIFAWARANQPDRADRLLQFMYDGGVVKPNERSFNIVLSAWAKEGAAEKAEAILTRMHELHSDGELETQPTVVTYNTVLDSWAKSKRQDAGKRGAEILRHMEELYSAGDSGVKPNARTWNTVLNCYAKAGQVKRAEKLIILFTQASKENRVDGKPNVRTWNTLLAACLEERNTRMAKRIWRRMKEHGIQPDIVSYNTLLNCFARSGRDFSKDTETTFHELQQDHNVTPNRITYLALINSLIGAGKLDSAEGVLYEMCKDHAENDSEKPDRALFHKVLAAWSNHQSPRKAEALVLTMAELHNHHGLDLKPTVETYNRLLNGWAKSMEHESGERADLILRQMEEFAQSGEKYVSPDIATYNTVLNAWANSRNPTAVTRAERLILEMILKGNPKLAPDEVSYGTWLKVIASSDEHDKGRRAKEVLKTMKIHNLKPTDHILKTVENLTGPIDNVETSSGSIPVL